MSTRKKILVVLGTCALLAVIVTVVVAVAIGGGKPAASPSETPRPSASPSLGPLKVEVYEETIEDVEAKNPVVSKVPKQTPYWRVELLGSGERDGKLVIDATVYAKPDENQERAIDKQRPYIERWLTGIGQAKGTYVLEIKTEVPHTY